MKDYKIHTVLGLPVVPAIIVGPKISRRVELVFDSGAISTQIHIGSFKAVGFSFQGRSPDTSVKGVTGQAEGGFLLRASRFFVLGRRFEGIELSAFDFNDWVKDGVDGLLGWDIIKQFHLEMNGPTETLRVF